MGMRRSMLMPAVWAVVCAAVTGTAFAQTPARFGIGRTATAAEVAALDIDITPDGAGLPAGRGTAAEGAPIYAAKCAQCHGKTGTEGPNDVLVGREPRTGFTFSADPLLPRTIGSYWPYATTVFDYVRRAMPTTAPGSLTSDEVYALTAFLLHANEITEADAVMDRTSLPKVAMPARQYFEPDTRKQLAEKPKP